MDSLEHLPGELRRNFTLMFELDEKNKKILQEVDAASDDYLRKVRELPPEKRRAEMENIQKMFKKAKNYGDDKVSIALQTYEMVDKHIRRLDGDLTKFESEMREKGRLSQTESEEDDADDGEEAKAPGKKRGRKKGQTAKEAPTKKKKAGKAAAGAADEDKGKKKSKKVAGQKSGDATPAPLFPIQQEIIDMPVDPNEPTYCLCQQVSYGEMIGCDNNDCPIEWFHFGCMNLTTKPKGKWYCPKCAHLFKKKKGT